MKKNCWIFFDEITLEEFKSPEFDIKDLFVLVFVILYYSNILITGNTDFADVKIDKMLIFISAKHYELIKEIT